LLCVSFFPTRAQYSITASIGVGTADAGAKDAGFLSGISITNYRSLTGGITFLQDISRSIKIGGALSFQQYIVKSEGGGGKGLFNGGDRIELDENDAYLFLGPVLDIRIFKFLYLDVGPSVGILLKGNERYGVGDPPAFSATDGAQRTTFQIGIALKEPIRITDRWKIILSEGYNFMPGILSTTQAYNNGEIKSNFATIQIGVMRRYPKQQKAAKK